MGYEQNERSSAPAVIIIVAVLLGFFMLLCVGAGGLMFVGLRSDPVPGVGPAVAPAPMPATVPADYAEEAEIPMERADVTVSTPVSMGSDGTIRIDGEEAASDELESRLGALARGDSGFRYLFLDVRVAPDCRAEVLIDFLDRVRRLEFCEVELSVADRP